MPKKGKNNSISTVSKNLEKLTVSKKTQKNRRKRAAKKLRDAAMSGFNTEKTMPSEMVMSKSVDTGLRRLRRTPRAGLSDAGLAFLKCAFAPPDFLGSSVGGVPDDFRGVSLVRKHRYVNTVNLTNAADYYYLLLPTPGYAYFFATTAPTVAPTSATVWTGVAYTDYSQMFGASRNDTANQVQRFRHISNHIEIIPTVNSMTWSGTIQAWKIPIQVQTRPNGVVGDTMMVTGLEGSVSTLANQYSGPFINGLYAGCYGSNPQFTFTSILENIVSVPTTITASDWGQLSTSNVGFPGFDNGFESLLVKITGVTANEPFLMKTWSCVEYQCSPNSTLYEFQNLSPCDPLAISLYREIILELPVGVPFEENDSFWERVLRIINTLTTAGGMLPGSVGMASRGLSLLSGAGLSLFR